MKPSMKTRRISHQILCRAALLTWTMATLGGVTVRVTFDAETENSIEKQRQGWQAILNNFAKYVEASR
jgi:hypothetical protein